MKRLIIIALIGLIGLTAYGQKPRNRHKEDLNSHYSFAEQKLHEFELERELERKYYPTNRYVKMGAEYETEPQGNNFNVAPEELVIGDCVLKKNPDVFVYYETSRDYYWSLLEFFRKNYTEIGNGYVYNNQDGGLVTQFIDKENERIMFSIFPGRYSTRIYITDRLVDYSQRLTAQQEKKRKEEVMENTITSIETAGKIIL